MSVGTRTDQTHKTPKDLNALEREEHGRGEGVGLYTVHIRKRGGGGRGEYGLRNAISDVTESTLRYVSLADLGRLCQVGLR